MDPAALTQMVEDLGQLWSIPELPSKTTVEFSSRMTRSLGRCFPHRGLIRLNAALLQREDRLTAEVLCHEVAHLAVYLSHGDAAQPHGEEWQSLVRLAGYQPARALAASINTARGSATPMQRETTHLFEHRCPVCQSIRVARTASQRWRCSECTADGLEGDLVISPLGGGRGKA